MKIRSRSLVGIKFKHFSSNNEYKIVRCEKNYIVISLDNDGFGSYPIYSYEVIMKFFESGQWIKI